MKHMLDRLSGKPGEEEGDDHAQAKMQVLHELRNMAMDMMGDKVKGKMPMHEVDVAAPDMQGLHKGLDLAKQVLPKSDALGQAAEDAEEQTEHGRSEPSGDEGEPDQQMLNPHRDMSSEDDEDDMDEDEIDSMIAELQAKKQAKSGKSY